MCVCVCVYVFVLAYVLDVRVCDSKVRVRLRVFVCLVLELAGVKKSPTCWQNSTLGSQIRFILERFDEIEGTCKFFRPFYNLRICL